MDDDEIIIPQQFRTVEESRRPDPNYRLWCAVLVRAFEDLDVRCERASARWWFTGKNTGLEEVCAVTGRSVKGARRRAAKICGERKRLERN